MGSHVDDHPDDAFTSSSEADATLQAPSLAREPPVPQGCLVYVTAGGKQDQGRWIRSSGDSLVLGRGKACHLRLHDPNVSRRHVKISMVSGGVEVQDLGSRNGIGYLGRQIHGARLPLGARIQVGGCTIDILPLENDVTFRASQRERYGGLVGGSLPMRRLYALLEALEGSDAPVLVQGETGTGKELVARAIHAHSARRDRPFVVIDCSNVPGDLTDSELFGHRRGSFTGAVADHPGAFQAAHGGTVFLDEIGELAPALQSKLLRVLESGEIKRLGDVQHRRVNVRILAATNRRLDGEVSSGRFRQDLYYRLVVVQVDLPPLRDRPEDIPVLARHLLRQLTRGSPPEDLLSPEVEESLLRHEWPGNVRQLRNTLQRMLTVPTADLTPPAPLATPMPEVAIQAAASQRPPAPQPIMPTATVPSRSCEPSAITARSRPPTSVHPTGYPSDDAIPSHVTLHAPLDAPYRDAKEQLVTAFERRYLEHLWAQVDGNVSEAARRAGLDRKYLRTLLRKHGIR